MLLLRVRVMPVSLPVHDCVTPNCWLLLPSKFHVTPPGLSSENCSLTAPVPDFVRGTVDVNQIWPEHGLYTVPLTPCHDAANAGAELPSTAMALIAATATFHLRRDMLLRLLNPFARPHDNPSMGWRL